MGSSRSHSEYRPPNWKPCLNKISVNAFPQQHHTQQVNGDRRKCSWVDARQGKMWSGHSREHHWALETKEILTQSPTRGNLQDTMLSEISQSQKDTVLLHWYEELCVKVRETENRMVLPGAGKRGLGSECLLKREFQFYNWKRFQRWVAVRTAHDMNVLNTTELLTYKWFDGKYYANVFYHN